MGRSFDIAETAAIKQEINKLLDKGDGSAYEPGEFISPIFATPKRM